ncbi:MAG: ATP-binding cassette domain-containing protein [Saprospiraceae bacterium]|nr:ATP-binding cassette domain-containing protein [Saprospiraceae bacterium]MDZ4705539.1 ATP-binding cassette domain-containing protein [Saprospiraceae bacterium]
MLQTKALFYSYDGRNQLQFPDIDCKKGEHWLLLGQSGSGKTTLLHLLGGLLSPKGGVVNIDGTNIANLKGSALDRFRGQRVGIIFQKAHFVKSLTVEENLLLAQQLAGAPASKTRIRELLERLNVGHKHRSKPDRLSAGEQQRVAIARALVNQPAIILADEPTSALDDVNCNEVIHLLEEQAAAVSATLLVVTHDSRLKAAFRNQIHL